jgi:hypothetical protein
MQGLYKLSLQIYSWVKRQTVRLDSAVRRQSLNSVEQPVASFCSLSYPGLLYIVYIVERVPITVAARSKAWTVFALSNTGIMGSNPTWDTDVCVRLFYVCAVLCAGSGLTTGWSPVQRVLPTVYTIKNLKSGQGPTKGCRARDTWPGVVRTTENQKATSHGCNFKQSLKTMTVYSNI